MPDIKNELEKIQGTAFFSNMGSDDINNDNVIFIDSLHKAFIEPCNECFAGRYSDVLWLPTSPTQSDLFYGEVKNLPG